MRIKNFYMKSKYLWVAIVVAVAVAAVFFPKENPTPSPLADKQTVKVAIVKSDPDANGAIKIGCGDEIVFIDRQVSPTTGVLRAAMSELLVLAKDPQFNSLDAYDTTGATFVSRGDGSSKLENVTIENGLARLYFTGQPFVSGGTCDDPRVSAQVYYTATQFPTVKDIEVYLNGVLIGTGGSAWSYFSQKG